MMNLDHPLSDPGLASPDAPDADFAVCLECGAEDVLFLPHNADCTEAGDIVVKAAPQGPWTCS